MAILERVASIIAPFNCLSCESEGSLACGNCWQSFCIALPSRCYRCRAATDSFAVCERCRKQSSLRHVWVRTSLKDLPKELLYRFKFERAQSAAETIAKYMAEALPGVDEAVIVPVPTATSRVRVRGYDHAYLLARQLSPWLKLPITTVLRRVSQTRQVGAKRDVRTRQLAGAYRIVNRRQIEGKNILLVDDVVTSGASLEAAARILRAAGAKTVSAVVFAQN